MVDPHRVEPPTEPVATQVAKFRSFKLARGRLESLGEGIHGDVRDGNLPAEEERAAVGVDEVAERFLSRKPRTPRGIGRAARETPTSADELKTHGD